MSWYSRSRAWSHGCDQSSFSASRKVSSRNRFAAQSQRSRVDMGSRARSARTVSHSASTHAVSSSRSQCVRGAAVHRVYAREHLEEIAALCELEDAGLRGAVFALDAEFSSADEKLPRREERNAVAHDALPRDFAAHEEIIVAAVAVALEVGVV